MAVLTYSIGEVVIALLLRAGKALQAGHHGGHLTVESLLIFHVGGLVRALHMSLPIQLGVQAFNIPNSMLDSCYQLKFKIKQVSYASIRSGRCLPV